MNPVLPVFDKSIIGDYNVEGFDSVDSVDFEPGFGCVVERIQPFIALPEMKDNRTQAQRKADDDNMAYLFMTDAEKEEKEDEFLKQHGV